MQLALLRPLRLLPELLPRVPKLPPSAGAPVTGTNAIARPIGAIAAGLMEAVGLLGLAIAL